MKFLRVYFELLKRKELIRRKDCLEIKCKKKCRRKYIVLYYCYYYYYYYLFYHHSLGFINKQLWLQSFLYHPSGKINRYFFYFCIFNFLNFICLLTLSFDGKTESLQLLLPFMMDQER